MNGKESIPFSQEEKENPQRLFNLSLFGKERTYGIIRMAEPTADFYFPDYPDKTKPHHIEINPFGEIIKSTPLNFKPINTLGESINISHTEDDRSTPDGSLHGVTAVLNNHTWYPAVYKKTDDSWGEEINLRVFDRLEPGKNALPVKREEEAFLLYRPEHIPQEIWGYQLKENSLELKSNPEPFFVWHFLPAWWSERRIGLVSEGFPLNNGKKEEFLPVHGQYYDQANNICYALGGCVAKVGINSEIKLLAHPFLTPQALEEVVGRKLPQAIPGKLIVYSCGSLKKDDHFEMAVSVGDSWTFYLKTPWSEIEEYVYSEGNCLPSWQLVWELKAKKDH